MVTSMAFVTFQNSMAVPMPLLAMITMLVSESSRYRKMINCSAAAVDVEKHVCGSDRAEQQEGLCLEPSRTDSLCCESYAQELSPTGAAILRLHDHFGHGWWWWWW